VAIPTDSLLLPEQWSNSNLVEVGGTASYKTTVLPDSEYALSRGAIAFGYAASNGAGALSPAGAYLRAEGSVGTIRSLVGTASQLHVRAFGGVARGAPRQRAIYASTQDPFETFNNDLFRPRDAVLKQRGVNYLPLGGAGLRGFGVNVPLDAVIAGNGEIVQRLATAKGKWGQGTASFSIFADAGSGSASRIELPNALLTDAGAGLILRGRIYDRNFYARLDAPLIVNHTSLAGGQGLGGSGSFAPRWTISVGDLWE
jgi:hypothetical protein